MSLPTNPNLLMAGGTSPYYNVQRSLRFRLSASAYLNRTFSTPTDQKKFTFSFWAKLGSFGTSSATILGACTSTANNDSYIYFSNNKLIIGSYQGAGTDYGINTIGVFRDYSAWYHCVAVFDTANSTAADRAILYVNGVRQAVNNNSNGMFPLNHTCLLNSATAHNIARRPTGNDIFYDGYLTEINFIDGQALTPSSFGYNDPVTGVWMPKRYSGSFGTNGFYLPFSNTTSTTTLVADQSGNGNNWTPNNISLTSGVTYDSMIDSPTNYADGGNGRGNYCVVSQVDKNASLSVTNGNLAFSYGSAAWIAARGTIGITSGKWYWEFTPTSASSHCNGISTKDSNLADVLGSNASGWGYWQAGYKYNSGSPVLYGATYTTNDVIGVAFDADAGTLTFYKNGVSQGTAFSGLAANTYFPAVSVNAGSCEINFGQRPFSYTPPSGFVALNTQNLRTPTILNGANYMAATTYTGTGSALSISNQTNSGNNPLQVPMQPDFVWIKGRSSAYNHALFDSVRGALKLLISNSTGAEVTEAAGTSLTGFSSNGFALGTNGGAASTNVNSQTFIGWQWQAGKGSSSIPSGGTITPTGASINTTAGFSIITYTGTGANATVPHGLGAAPSMIIVKSRTAAYNWNVYTPTTGAGNVLQLNTTAASTASSDAWNSASPTSTLFSVGTNVGTNESTKTYVAYCWTAIPGFSAFGSYTGNGSTDGPFIFTGFRIRYLLIKCSSVGGTGWYVYDTTRNPYNVADLYLRPEVSDAETTFTTVDILSNGFKIRTSNTQFNGANTYIFAAFAENPFKVSRAR